MPSSKKLFERPPLNTEPPMWWIYAPDVDTYCKETISANNRYKKGSKKDLRGDLLLLTIIRGKDLKCTIHQEDLCPPSSHLTTS